MDMLDYAEGKAEGAVALTKVGFETFQLVAKKFHATTGKETYPEITTINREAVKQAKVATQKQIDDAAVRMAGIIQLEADLDALDVKPV